MWNGLTKQRHGHRRVFWTEVEEVAEDDDEDTPQRVRPFDTFN